MLQSLRRIVAVGLIVSAALLETGTAGAVPPTKEDLGVFRYELSVDCSPYGFDFTIDVVGQATVWVETFVDASGEPVRVVVHDSSSETDTNSVTGETVPMRGQSVTTYDLVAGTRTVNGKTFLMTVPGSGAAILDVGRVVFDAPFQVSFEAGPHEVLHGGVGAHLDELACNALAGD
jgi:hypothetical protein